jgi:hypothetical protein
MLAKLKSLCLTHHGMLIERGPNPEKGFIFHLRLAAATAMALFAVVPAKPNKIMCGRHLFKEYPLCLPWNVLKHKKRCGTYP